MKPESLYLNNANRWFDNLPNNDKERISGYTRESYQGAVHEDDYSKDTNRWWKSLPDAEKISVWMKNKSTPR